MDMVSPNVLVCQALKEKVKPKQKGNGTDQKADRRVDRRSRLIAPNGHSQHIFGDYKYMFESLELIANATLPSCFWLARERGFKTKITDLMVVGIGLSWV
ncbi:hypothetical protein H5410_003683 [Solanum commersonii]|uniref:Uncharacterized protein n=1 Tax=Solanum commersonii TaxID=4109 RepID=A0A9J6B5F1_SOLCO|nr:hypothetical protein H5410_003683 [Solanum commersonii]